MLRLGSRLQIAIVIWKTHHLGRTADIDPLRVWPGRIKCDSVRLAQAAGEDRGLFSFAICRDAAENTNPSRLGLRKKDIAIGGRTQKPRILQARGVQLNLESRQ